MDLQEKSIRLIHDFQQKFDVSRLEIEGIGIWPVILFELHKHNEAHPKKLRKNLFKMAIRELKAQVKMQTDSFRDRKSHAANGKEAEILFLTQSTRRVKIDTSWYDRICDPFVDAFESIGFKCQTLEWSYDHQYKVPRHKPSDLIQLEVNLSLFRAFFSGRLIKSGFPALESEDFQEILEKHDFTFGQFMENIDLSLRLIFSLKKYFDKKLRNIPAKIAFYFPYYSVVSFAFNLACKDKGIPAVEIQHGYFADRTYMQNGHRNIKNRYRLFPDAIWVWGEREKEMFLRWGKKSLPHIFIGGNLWMNLWLYPELNNRKLGDGFDSQLDSLKKNQKKIILFTLSAFLEIPEWLPSALSSAGDDILFCIRFHHNSSQEYREKTQKSLENLNNVEYETSNSFPLPALLEACDLHVTIDSSSVIEAIDFSIQSIIISENGVFLFPDLIDERKWAFPALTAPDFLTTLNTLWANSLSNKKTTEKSMAKSNAEIVKEFYNLIKSKTTN